MKLVTIVIAILLLVGGGWYYMDSKDTAREEGSVSREEMRLAEKDMLEMRPVDLVENENSETRLAGDTESRVTTGENMEGSINAGEGELVGDDAVVPVEEEGVKSFTVLGTNFSFDMKAMKVKKGDEVTVTFRSVSGQHNWSVDEFDAATEIVQTDGEASVTFVADQVGTFEYYCAVGDHKERGMVGSLVVEE